MLIEFAAGRNVALIAIDGSRWTSLVFWRAAPMAGHLDVARAAGFDHQKRIDTGRPQVTGKHHEGDVMAKKCDVCGAVADIHLGEQERRVFVGTVAIRNIGQHVHESAKFDACESCRDQLEQLLVNAVRGFATALDPEPCGPEHIWLRAATQPLHERAGDDDVATD